MPLRHSISYCNGPNERRELQLLLQYVVDEREAEDRENNSVLERFSNAMDKRKVKSEETVYFPDSDILQHADYSPTLPSAAMSEHPVYKSILKFLIERMPQVSEYQITPPKEPVVLSYKLFVSLSGGVDSMVIAKVLSHIVESKALVLKDSSQIKKRQRIVSNSNLESKNHSSVSLDIVIEAVHINYGNREESGAETHFVERWCTLNGIKCFTTAITDVKRGVTSRDEYEQVSRRLRYQAYKDRQFPHCLGMLFGHHQGDVQENVLSNAVKGCSIMEISGMTSESVNDKVLVWRPLLAHKKDDIFDFAHKFGVPYFKDSTPRWSTRGKLRNHLWHSLAVTYGDGFGTQLYNLGLQSDQLNTFMNDHVFQPFLSRITHGVVAVGIPLEGYLDHPNFFWKYVLRQICHSLSYSMIKDKPVEKFVGTLNARKFSTKQTSNCLWLPLKQEIKTLIHLEKTLFLFHPDTLFDRSLKFQIRVGERLQVGKFSVQVAQEPLEDLKEHFNIFEWLRTGKLCYSLPAQESYSLCDAAGRFIPFFKNVDRKLRESIPIVSSTLKMNTENLCYVRIDFINTGSK